MSQTAKQPNSLSGPVGAAALKGLLPKTQIFGFVTGISYIPPYFHPCHMYLTA